MTDLSMVDSSDKELDATTPGPNYYVMVKFAFKKATRHYVGMIVKPADDFFKYFILVYSRFCLEIIYQPTMQIMVELSIQFSNLLYLIYFWQKTNLKKVST